MKSGIVNIGTWTKNDELRVARKVNRDLELQNSTGWVCKHKVHKSAKNYTRKSKHKVDFI